MTPSPEQAFAALLAMPAELQALRDEVRELRSLLNQRSFARPTYDARQLQEELGYSKNQAYEILRAYGSQRAGRRRITADDLARYLKGADDESPH